MRRTARWAVTALAVTAVALPAPVASAHPNPGPTAFLSGDLDPVQAARWDTCEPIRWGVDPVNIPLSGTTADEELARWRTVVKAVDDATNFSFVEVPVVPGASRHSSQEIPSARGVDILVGYESPSNADGFQRLALADPGRVGMTVFDYTITGTRKHPLGAFISIDYPQVADLIKRGEYTSADRVRLLAHEFGHALGLAHSTLPTDTMYESWMPASWKVKRGKALMRAWAGYTPASLAALHQLDDQPC